MYDNYTHVKTHPDINSVVELNVQINLAFGKCSQVNVGHGEAVSCAIT